MGTPTVVAGITIPDSAIVSHATELLREHGNEFLYNHSLRVFLFASLNGRENNVRYDPELLYVSAAFHDLGLTPHYRSDDKRFEIDGANAARDFLKSYNISAQMIQLVWDAIALHTSPGIAEYKEPEVALLNYGTALDVIGRGYDRLSGNDREEIISRFPRAGLKEKMIPTFFEGFKHKPHTTYGSINEDICVCMIPGYRRKNLCDLILQSPWKD
jgi:hypothetical protein